MVEGGGGGGGAVTVSLSVRVWVCTGELESSASTVTVCVPAVLWQVTLAGLDVSRVPSTNTVWGAVPPLTLQWMLTAAPV